MSPLFLFSKGVILLLASFIKGAEKLEEPKNLKRLRDANFEQLGSTCSPCNKRISSNPPDLFRSISDPFYFGKLPPKIKEFARIFKIAWIAHAADFKRTNHFNFESMDDWESARDLSFETHIEFIKQFLKNGSTSTFEHLNCWEFLREYIKFTFTNYSHEIVSIESFNEILILSVKSLEPQTFETIMKYCPEYYSYENFNTVWFALLQTAIDRNLVVSDLSRDAKKWVKLFYFSCLNFGSFPFLNNFENQQVSKVSNKIILRLNHLIKLQPIISAFVRHDSPLFMEIFLNDKIIEIFNEIGTNSVYFWFNCFLALDENIKIFNPQNEQKFSDLADKLYYCLCGTNSFVQLIENCAASNRHVLPQFILMYSDYARYSISDKAGKCQLLLKLVQITEFDFDYMSMVTIITGFDLKWSDLEEHLLPSLEIHFRDTPLINGLEFILQVAESFPINFDPSVLWTIPSSISSSPLRIDSEYPFLLDAARIILARHFKILPIFTLSNEIETEEACFRDLCWFMTFYINLYRPDMGSNYKIILNS